MLQWLSRLAETGDRIACENPTSPGIKRDRRFTDKISVAMDQEMCDQLHCEALRLRISSSELIRIYIRKGLPCV